MTNVRYILVEVKDFNPGVEPLLAITDAAQQRFVGARTADVTAALTDPYCDDDESASGVVDCSPLVYEMKAKLS